MLITRPGGSAPRRLRQSRTRARSSPYVYERPGFASARSSRHASILSTRNSIIEPCPSADAPQVHDLPGHHRALGLEKEIDDVGHIVGFRPPGNGLSRNEPLDLVRRNV